MSDNDDGDGIGPSRSSRATSLSASGMRVSQRQPLSCSECTRRKTRCDKTVPCANCRKRGVPDRCRVEQVIPSKAIRTVSHVQLLRQEIEITTSRLERRIAELEGLVRGQLGLAVNRHLETVRGDEGEDDKMEILSRDGGEGDARKGGADDEAEAAATLEFLAMGRLRAKSPGGIEDLTELSPNEPSQAEEEEGDADMELEFDWATGTPPGVAIVLDRKPPSVTKPSPLVGSGSTSRQPPAVETPGKGLQQYRQALQADILGRLPNPDLGRLLVKYDLEHVAWMHCCYHGPTFQSESDLFWAELGAKDVEINWSFLALMFSVLMSTAHHMPVGMTNALFPRQSLRALLESWFDGCLMSLQEANWMSSHSLYAVQCIAILINPANHLGKADLYYTMLGTGIKIAQALNLHRLGPDPYPAGGRVGGPAVIAREVRKRTWWQLIIQDWFHVAFNGTCAIQAHQFNTPPPLHCVDQLLSTSEAPTVLPKQVPTVDSHTTQLLKLALQINKVYSKVTNFSDVPYDSILKFDTEMQGILAEAPTWMTDEKLEPDASAPVWLEWQTRSYMVSSAHKVIVLHRPYLGRAFKGDARYTVSRERCLTYARRILDIFHRCNLETFRKTWTVLAHTIAACLVILLEASHRKDDEIDLDGLLIPVQTAVLILQQIAPYSTIAQRGVVVISPLLEEQFSSPDSPGRAEKRKEFHGKAEQELDRAQKMFRRPRRGGSKTASSARETDPATSVSPQQASGGSLDVGFDSALWANAAWTGAGDSGVMLSGAGASQAWTPVPDATVDDTATTWDSMFLLDVVHEGQPPSDWLDQNLF